VVCIAFGLEETERYGDDEDWLQMMEEKKNGQWDIMDLG
jgi:hypothetical protein